MRQLTSRYPFPTEDGESIGWVGQALVQGVPDVESQELLVFHPLHHPQQRPHLFVWNRVGRETAVVSFPDPIHLWISFPDPIHPWVSLPDPIHHWVSLPDPIHHWVSLPDPIHHWVSLPDPIHHWVSLPDPIHPWVSLPHFFSLLSHTNRQVLLCRYTCISAYI